VPSIRPSGETEGGGEAAVVAAGVDLVHLKSSGWLRHAYPELFICKRYKKKILTK
jgi:hypothetical protein